MMTSFAIRMSGTVVAGAVVLGAAVYLAPHAPSAVANAAPLSLHAKTVTKRTLREALAQAGLSPAALAAAGLSSQGTSDLIGRVRSCMDESEINIEQVFATFRAASLQARTLQQKVQAGTATSQDASAFAAAQAALESAASARDTAIASLVTAAVDGLSEGATAAIGHLRSNRPSDLPIQYLVVARSDSDRLKLRDSLALERDAAAKGQSVDSATAEFLAGVNTDSAVIAAKAGLTHLADIETAWNAAISEQ